MTGAARDMSLGGAADKFLKLGDVVAFAWEVRVVCLLHVGCLHVGNRRIHGSCLVVRVCIISCCST